MKASIGLFGGTFDPVHNGHISIAQSFLDSGLIDELWVLLTPDPPHKSEKVQARFAYREKMLEAAFSEFSSIRISTIENTLPRPTYTIQTLQYLTKNYPANQYYLCIGEDSLIHFKEWYRYQDILDLCNLIVARRSGFSGDELEESILDHVYFIDHELVNISSSEIRTLLYNQESVEEYVPRSVLEIIQEFNLYQPDS